MSEVGECEYRPTIKVAYMNKSGVGECEMMTYSYEGAKMNKSVVRESVIAQVQNLMEVGKFVMKDSEDCAKDDDNEEDGPINVCAFRKMPRAIKEGLKRLQDGPKRS